jgi:hypothetical protein
VLDGLCHPPSSDVSALVLMPIDPLVLSIDPLVLFAKCKIKMDCTPDEMK